jgi:hypothetical protein
MGECAGYALTRSPSTKSKAKRSDRARDGYKSVKPIFEKAWISASRCAQWQERACHWQMSHEATTPSCLRR